MKTNHILLTTLVLSALTLAACAPGAAPTAMMSEATTTPGAMMQGTSTPEAMMSQGSQTPGAMMSDTATPEAMMPEGSPTPGSKMMQDTSTPGTGMSMDTVTPDAMLGQAGATQEAAKQMADWLGTPLTDASSGHSFKLSDFSGKVVLVEMMAVWCPTCHTQQQQIQSLHQMLGQTADFASVSLDIDPNESLDILAKYVQSNSFDWMYAVSPAALSREIGQTYGNQFLDPPSTPILLIDRHGVVHPLPLGLKSAQDLMKAVQQYLGM